MTGCQKPKFFVENQEQGFKIFTSNMCLINLGALCMVKISARSALPFSSSGKRQKEGGGGVPLI